VGAAYGIALGMVAGIITGTVLGNRSEENLDEQDAVPK